jgi:hypothetical protein
MQIDAFSRDQLASMFKALIDLDVLSVEDIELAFRKSELTPEMRRMVDLIHSIFCINPHDGDTPFTCLYYVEENLENTWTLNSHILWITDAFQRLSEMGISNEKQLSEALRVAKDCKLKLDTTPGAKELLLHWLS